MTSEPTDLSARIQGMPFALATGLRDITAADGVVTAYSDWKQEYCTGGNILHGGFLMAIADSIGAIAAGQHLPPGHGTTTIESKTNFIRPITSGAIKLTATTLHAGRTTIVVVTDITREDGKLAARVTQTQAVLTPRG
jgi:1,4-dihydroxy-2-naphthoyl-CoA hydrolase